MEARTWLAWTGVSATTPKTSARGYECPVPPFRLGGAVPGFDVMTFWCKKVSRVCEHRIHCSTIVILVPIVLLEAGFRARCIVEFAPDDGKNRYGLHLDRRYLLENGSRYG